MDHTRYEKNNGEYLNISNSWSRKSIRFIFSEETGTTLWTLQNKCTFSLRDEYGVLRTEDSLPDCFEDFDLELESWISTKIIEHIDFLVEKHLRPKKEILLDSIENKSQ